MKKLVSLVVAITLCVAMAGCASHPTADGDRAATGGSGVTVFGTIDAGVTHTRNR